MTALTRELSVGDLIDGKYRVERQIGEGGMGIVLAARHVTLGERYALKVLTEGSDDTLRRRFLREAQAAARITSEHITKVFDVGLLEDGSPYMVMELLEGEDLDARLARTGPLGLAEAVDYLVQASEALAEAHGLGIVHRDVKPGNLFLTTSETGQPLVKLLDFGISKDAVKTVDDRITRLTRTGSVLGSPQFMAPEQLVSSRDVDARADVWSLGTTLFELLTSEPAFDGRTMADLYSAILRDPPRSLRELRPDLPQELERIIGRCLEKDVLDRYGTVAELVEALSPYAPVSAQASIRRITKSVEPIAPTLHGDTLGEIADGKPPRALLETLLPLVRRLDPVAQTEPPRPLMETLVPLVRRLDPVAPLPDQRQSLASAPTTIMERRRDPAVVTAPSASPIDVTAPSASPSDFTAASSSASTRAALPGAALPTIASRPSLDTPAAGAPSARAGTRAAATPLRRMRLPLVLLVLLAIAVLAVGARKYYRASRAPAERESPRVKSSKRPANDKRERRAKDPARTWPVPDASGTDDEKIPKSDRDDAEVWLAAGADHLDEKQWSHAESYANRVLVLVEASGLRMHQDDSPLAARALALSAESIALQIAPDAPLQDHGRMGPFMTKFGQAEFWDKSGRACILRRRLHTLRVFAEAAEKYRGPGWQEYARHAWAVIGAQYESVAATGKRFPPACQTSLSELVAFSKEQEKKYTP